MPNAIIYHKDLNKIFKELVGQKIQKFSFATKGAEQYFHLITNKVDLKFTANDLGAWSEKYLIKFF